MTEATSSNGQSLMIVQCSGIDLAIRLSRADHDTTELLPYESPYGTAEQAIRFNISQCATYRIATLSPSLAILRRKSGSPGVDVC